MYGKIEKKNQSECVGAKFSTKNKSKDKWGKYRFHVIMRVIRDVCGDSHQCQQVINEVWKWLSNAPNFDTVIVTCCYTFIRIFFGTESVAAFWITCDFEYMTYPIWREAFRQLGHILFAPRRFMRDFSFRQPCLAYTDYKCDRGTQFTLLNVARKLHRHLFQHIFFCD